MVRVHGNFIAVLVAGAVIWALVFYAAAVDFVTGGERPFRAVWNGFGEFSLFGLTVPVNFEGYLDYDYYYVSWADRFLSGHMPYTDEFNYITVGDKRYNTPYFLPPLYLYMCVLGRILPVQPFGIGLLITVFGFLTVFPVYGITHYLSQNRRLAEVASVTYLLNPLVLYHCAFEWLNPAPFVFFAMLSFYLLMSGRRTLGVLAMVTSVMFKQTAFFFALPLVAYVLKRAPGAPIPHGTDGESGGAGTTSSEGEGVDKDESADESSGNDESGRAGGGRPEGDHIDTKGFVQLALIALGYATALSLPYVLDPTNYLFYIFVKPGAVRLGDYTSPPPVGFPMVLAVLIMVAGAPQWAVQLVDTLTYYTVGLVMGVVPLFALMLFEVKDDEHPRAYWRRMMLLTLLLILWMHVWSPRGIYKYYLVAVMPLVSVLTSSRMCSREDGAVPVTLSALFLPGMFSSAVLLLDRNVYLVVLIVAFIGYVFHRQIGRLYGRVASRVAAAVQRDAGRPPPMGSGPQAPPPSSGAAPSGSLSAPRASSPAPRIPPWT